MNVIYRPSSSNTQPNEIDISSSAEYVYVRRDIRTVVVTDESGQERTVYEYQEAVLTRDEYETYYNTILANRIQGNDNSLAWEHYVQKLNVPVVYPVTTFTYKPKWAAETYEGWLDRGLKFPQLFPLKVYDSTEQEERAVSMSMEQLTQLTFFLAGVQEQYFQEYKREKAGETE